MQKNYLRIILDRTAEKNNAVPESSDDSMSKGTDATITLNYELEIKTLVQNKKGKNIYESCPTYITLAHELIHADRIRRGKKLMQYVYKINDATGDMEREEELQTIGSPIKFRDEKNPNVSYGIIKNDNDGITENDIRSEHNLKYRISHDGKQK